MGALPKRRRTRSRRYARRQHLRLTVRRMGRCMNCRALLVSHQVCPVCGNYRGNAVVEAGEQASKYR